MGTTTAAPTRLQILEDALKWARLKGAAQDGGHVYEIKLDDAEELGLLSPAWAQEMRDEGSELYDPLTSDLTKPEVREKVCGVCLAGAVYLSLLEHGVDPFPETKRLISPFDDLEPFARQAADEMGYVGISYFNQAIQQLGTPYLVRALELAIAAERASLQ